MQLAAEKIWEKAPVELSIVEKKVPSLALSKARLDASLRLIIVIYVFGRTIYGFCTRISNDRSIFRTQTTIVIEKLNKIC